MTFLLTGPALAGAGAMQDSAAGPLWAVMLWRHHPHSTVLRPFWLKGFSKITVFLSKETANHWS